MPPSGRTCQTLPHTTAARTIQPAHLLLDGQPVPFVGPDLTTGSSTGSAVRLIEPPRKSVNPNLCKSP